MGGQLCSELSIFCVQSMYESVSQWKSGQLHPPSFTSCSVSSTPLDTGAYFSLFRDNFQAIIVSPPFGSQFVARMWQKPLIFSPIWKKSEMLKLYLPVSESAASRLILHPQFSQWSLDWAHETSHRVSMCIVQHCDQGKDRRILGLLGSNYGYLIEKKGYFAAYLG